MSKFKKPIIYLITRGNLTQQNYTKESKKTLQQVKSASESEVSLIQIREKKLPAKLVFNLAIEAVNITKNTNTKILVNERADVAFAANASGVHLTSNALPTNLIRKEFGTNFLIGVSTHTLEKALKAKNEGADFVTFSPIFPTISKVNYGEPKGLEKLKEIGDKLKPFPVLALGGIDQENCQSTLENGASGYAGISLFLNQFKK